jgi:3-hydroxyacyl-[acyl-carrier-protein] dehydratase/UDP-3-O-[3-hydroxymyristoyl] N-acetylglucosamine deacetylase/3-hydroxyacyl-[acyl-carrier-protein] dehydratase
MDKSEIKKIIPYDEPFLFLDEAEIVSENEIIGSYQTKPDDYYFKGHFVDFKIMPGVLVVEALAQLSTILLRKKIGENHKNFHFLAYDVRSCQFLKPIFPGNKIQLKAEILAIYQIPESKTKIARVKAQAFVEKDLKVEARFSVAIVDKKEFSKKYGV